MRAMCHMLSAVWLSAVWLLPGCYGTDQEQVAQEQQALEFEVPAGEDVGTPLAEESNEPISAPPPIAEPAPVPMDQRLPQGLDLLKLLTAKIPSNKRLIVNVEIDSKSVNVDAPLENIAPHLGQAKGVVSEFSATIIDSYCGGLMSGTSIPLIARGNSADSSKFVADRDPEGLSVGSQLFLILKQTEAGYVVQGPQFAGKVVPPVVRLFGVDLTAQQVQELCAI